jgi:hypothetical protein
MLLTLLFDQIEAALKRVPEAVGDGRSNDLYRKRFSSRSLRKVAASRLLANPGSVPAAHGSPGWARTSDILINRPSRGAFVGIDLAASVALCRT